MPREKGTFKPCNIPLEDIEKWQTFLVERGIPLNKEPTPLELMRAVFVEARRRDVSTMMVQPFSSPGPVDTAKPATAQTEASANLYSPKEWSRLKSNVNTQNGRWHSLEWLAVTFNYSTKTASQNGMAMDYDKVDKACMEILARVLGGEDPYRVGRKVCEHLMSLNTSSMTTGKTLRGIRAWFQINNVPINNEVWQAKVQPPKEHREKEKGLLDQKGVLTLLKDSDETTRALYEVMALTGGRINEVLSLKAKDIDQERVPGIPLLFFRKSKTDMPRHAPISPEALALINKVLGPDPDPETLIFKALPEYTTMSHRCHDQLLKYGLTKKKEWIRGGGKEAWTVSLHNFRQFAEDNMLEHGMNVDEAKWLVGRKYQAGSRAAYMTIERIAPTWKDKVEPFTHWLTGPVVETIVKEPEKALAKVPVKLENPVPASLKPQDPTPNPASSLPRFEKCECGLHFRKQGEACNRTPNLTAQEKVVGGKNASTLEELNPYARKLALAKDPEKFEAEVKRAIDEAIQGGIKKVDDMLSGPASKCYDCMKYHNNPVKLDGSGGPCPEKSPFLTGWSG